MRDLQKALAAESKREGALVGRIQRRLGAIVVAEMLTRVDLGTEGPPLLVKGGSALELRLGLAESRTSKDLDAVVRGSIATFMDQAAEAVAQPLAGFTGKVEKVAGDRGARDGSAAPPVLGQACLCRQTVLHDHRRAEPTGGPCCNRV